MLPLCIALSWRTLSVTLRRLRQHLAGVTPGQRLAEWLMSIMRAVVLEAPGPPEALQIRDLPIPVPDSGQVLIQVAAFGVNQSSFTPGLVWPRA